MEQLRKNVSCIELSEDNNKLSGIYCISNMINNKIYIGSTNCFITRKNQHFLELRGNYHTNPILQNFVNKYGINSLVFNILEIVDIDNLLIREQHYLDTYINFDYDFNICKLADRPNVNRQFSEEDIKNIANLYNSGKNATQISKIYFNTKKRQNYIAYIIKGELYPEYNRLFNEYIPTSNKSFSEQDIIKIAKLYNSGKTGCQISEILYGTRKHRAKINQLIKGETYKEFSHLFNYRKYSQLDKKRK